MVDARTDCAGVTGVCNMKSESLIASPGYFAYGDGRGGSDASIDADLYGGGCVACDGIGIATCPKVNIGFEGNRSCRDNCRSNP
jgi:hypothetical protein